MALFSGLDLGEVADFSALATLDRQPLENPLPRNRFRYSLRWLETWDLGTEYPTICHEVAERFESPALAWTPLAPDFTGVGRGVLHILRSAKPKARLHPIAISPGLEVTKMDPAAGIDHHKVPKKDLVGVFRGLIQPHPGYGPLITFPDPKRMPARTPAEKKYQHTITRFVRELQDFRVKITKSRNETYSADASQHDDLVLAVMLAAWLGENTGGGDVGGIGLPHAGAGSMLERAPSGTFAIDVPYHTDRRSDRD